MISADFNGLDERLAKLGRPLVFTNGCFDILHRGHVDYLEQASTRGVDLVVGVNTDASVKRLGKGDARPFNSVEDRMAVLAALRCVSLVVAFDEDTPLNLITRIQPDVLVKGGDWPVADIVGADVVTARGGTVESIAFRFERSTTSLVERIRAS